MMLRERLRANETIPFVGVYDVFSATLAAQHFDALFVSGFGFAASHYGLPDVGFNTWTDLVAYVQRLRLVMPDHLLLVDIDDGFVDVEVAAPVVGLMDTMGVAGVVLEDQRRPRRCGHLDGKVLLDVDSYVEKLQRVLAARSDLIVVARTDASAPEDIFRRVEAYAAAGADAILVDAVRDLAMVQEVREKVGRPVAFNQIAGGKSPSCTLTALHEVGVQVVIYSTPCLFAAQQAIVDALLGLKAKDGQLPAAVNGSIGVRECNDVLQQNLARRHGQP